jgi:hypothetical protein
VGSLQYACSSCLIGLLSLGATDCASRPVNASSENTLLHLACAPQGKSLLDCRALLSEEGVGIDGHDVTLRASWSTSNLGIAAVNNGHVSAVGPGLATIRASVAAPSGPETATTAILVEPDGTMQLAYTLRGELRDFNNTGVTNARVSLTIVGRQEVRVEDIVTTSDGSFRFFPVVAGQYQLQAEKPNYRPYQMLVSVPSDRPVTLVLLSEPTEVRALPAPSAPR